VVIGQDDVRQGSVFEKRQEIDIICNVASSASLKIHFIQ